MAATQTTQTCDLVIFGVKGDPARRKLLPSLYQLEKAGQISPDARIARVGRVDWDKATYTKVVRKALKTFVKEKTDESLWETPSGHLEFRNLDVNGTAAFKRLGKMLDQRSRTTTNYFAMPPSTFGAICKGPGEARLNARPTRVVMGEPPSISLATSRETNGQVGEYFEGCQVYRIDHYLGREAVLNLLVLRFASSLFVNNWDNRTIDHVEITMAEEVSIERRWDYSDQVGQTRNMIRNYLLQILRMIAMPPPPDLSADSIRDERVKVLKSLCHIDCSNVHEKTVRGQRTVGSAQGKKVLGYLEEEGADKNSNTEMFVMIYVDIDNRCRAGVPLYLRTGKRLPTKCFEVMVYFKALELNLFRESWQNLPQNKLTTRLQPDEGVDIQVLNKVSGLDHKHNPQITKPDLSYSETFNQTYLADIYERLLLEATRSIQVLFVRRDEIEEAWKWVDSITEAWAMDNDAPRPYQAGTWGPVTFVAMITRDGRS